MPAASELRKSICALRWSLAATLIGLGLQPEMTVVELVCVTRKQELAIGAFFEYLNRENKTLTRLWTGKQSLSYRSDCLPVHVYA